VVLFFFISRDRTNLDMDSAGFYVQGGFFEGFTQGWVGVAGAGDVFGTGAEGHGGRGFGDEVAGARADDVDAEDAVVLGVGEDFDFAVGVSQGAGAAVGEEGECAFFVRSVCLFELVFGFADGGDFRVCVGDAGNGVVVDMAVAGDDLFDAGDAFFFGFMGEHGAGNDVANGVEAGHVGGEMFVDFDAAALVGFDGDLAEAELVGVGDATDG
jgi:hypothetical protein